MLFTAQCQRSSHDTLSVATNTARGGKVLEAAVAVVTGEADLVKVYVVRASSVVDDVIGDNNSSSRRPPLTRTCLVLPEAGSSSRDFLRDFVVFLLRGTVVVPISFHYSCGEPQREWPETKILFLGQCQRLVYREE